MSKRRKHYESGFKVQVALEALTVTETEERT
jgi:hypothetical protein